MTTEKMTHLLIRIQGVVQGVGFRPFVCNLARSLALTGSVANTGTGVEIRLSGPAAMTRRFLQEIRESPPPLAQIFTIRVEDGIDREPSDTFSIAASTSTDERSTLISPDIATCDQCLEEIFSPADRRYRYPFTNCTNCGPRLTIISRTPYDRKNTSMASFTMCPRCEQEYHDPKNRRFHAQPNACPACGPSLSWNDHRGRLLAAGNDNQCLTECARALADGAIVAIKGLGGFHLAVDAASREAVQRLREKKGRPAKPLAVMAADPATAGTLAVFSARERDLLCGRQRPIVLARKKNAPLADNLAPGVGELGIMLPYTPLHHLLFAERECPSVLVMTSGNASDEPICTGNRDALHRLAAMADYFLLHDRGIVTRVDDSLVRVSGGRPQVIRRARGYVPLPVRADVTGSLLACGAELKNSFCLTRDGQIFTGQHIGDLKGADTMLFFEESVRFLQEALAIRPQRVVCDLHPDYLSSRYAASLGLPCTRVQHHHAHAAAIMAEHDLDHGLAVIYDGTGLGADGTVWGGEILLVRGRRYRRLAHLAPLPLPGGDRAAREIWRMGLALLAADGVDISDASSLPPSLRSIAPPLRLGIAQIIRQKINTPLTSSMGRLFDAVASLLAIRQESLFEAQAAMELEALAWQAYGNSPPEDVMYRYAPLFNTSADGCLLDFRPMLAGIQGDLEAGRAPETIALAFHCWIIRSTCGILEHLAPRHATRTVLLGGGCFQNRLLLEMLSEQLQHKGFRVFTGEQIPVNDGGIAVGQAYVAGCRR